MQALHGVEQVESEFTLWQLQKGARAVIVDFCKTMPAEYSGRLGEMGFHRGESVICLLRPGFGCPRVYRVSNTVYSLDRDLAAGIRVVPDV